MKTTAGPVLKFTLIKKYGEALREAGYEPAKMSCADLQAAIEMLNRSK